MEMINHDLDKPIDESLPERETPKTGLQAMLAGTWLAADAEPAA